jgi:hypothetical protein
MLISSNYACWLHNLLQPLEKVAARQQHAAVTSGTTYTDIRSDAVDEPLVTPTRVRLFHLHTVANVNILLHQ